MPSEFPVLIFKITKGILGIQGLLFKICLNLIRVLLQNLNERKVVVLTNTYMGGISTELACIPFYMGGIEVY